MSVYRLGNCLALAGKLVTDLTQRQSPIPHKPTKKRKTQVDMFRFLPEIDIVFPLATQKNNRLRNITW
ncbi:MAG: hypothetical protein ABJA84_05840 [Polaromonas sp.]